jgi:hypothetical protein
VDTAQITLPWGYKQIVPLMKTHRVQLVESGMAPPFSLNLHAVPLGASEFACALRDYPIVFQQRNSDGGFEAVVILGIQEGQNLFVMPDGRWDRRTYIPAYIRRYPFCVHTVRHESRPDERMIYVDPWSLADNGARLFDDSGVPLPHWVVIDRLLNEYEDELARVNRLAAVLHGLGVLTPFSLQANLFGGFTLSLKDLYRVDRNKLAALDVQPLRELIGSGDMELVYAHLLSQENFLRLMNRRSFFATRAAA